MLIIQDLSYLGESLTVHMNLLTIGSHEKNP